MSNIDDINKAAQILLEADIRLKTVQVELDSIDRELAALLSIEIQLNENIRFLKRKKVITIASEYKKILEQILKIKARKEILQMDRSRWLKIYESASITCEKARAVHVATLNKIKNSENNVLTVDFGKKDGKK